MYGKCGSIVEARAVFKQLLQPNVFSWTIMIGACLENGLAEEALEMISGMDQEGVKLDKITFIHATTACSSLGALARCKALHSRVAAAGFQSDAVVGNALLNMYCKAGSLNEAAELFRSLLDRDVVAWTSLISGYATQGLAKPFRLFKQMLLEGVKPNEVTLIALLGLCASVGSFDHAEFVHRLVESSGLASCISVATALVDVYGKCGKPELAAGVFEAMQHRDVVAWNAMAAVWTQHGRDGESLKLFWRMQLDGEQVDDVTFIAVLEACSNLKDLATGKRLHESILEAGLESVQNVANSLVNLYGKCGSVGDAWRVFEGMKAKNVVSWSAIVAAYAQNGLSKEALGLYTVMVQHGVKPDEYTFTTLVDACSAAGALAEGRAIHRWIEAQGLDKNLVVGTGLINMYGKCGNMEEARLMFQKLDQRRSLVSWTALIGSYAQHGGRRAVEFFRQMHMEGVQADDVVFLSLLHGCSHAGRLKEGMNCFKSMIGDHGILPQADHFGCMADLLARTGRLAEAEELLQSMPYELDVVQFKALLAACRVHGDRSRGERLAGVIPNLGPDESAPYLLMSRILSESMLIDAAEDEEQIDQA